MFDDAPSNLPVEPTTSPKPTPPTPPPVPPRPPSVETKVSEPPKSEEAPEPAVESPFENKGGKEPEDIFGDLDIEPKEKPSTESATEVALKSSIFKPLIIVLAVVVVLVAAGTAAWYLLIKPGAPEAPAIVAPVEEEMIIEEPPVLEEEPVTQPPEGVELPPPQAIAPTPPIIVQPVAAQDTDNDGLTDAEENVFGTNVSLADSDGDGFQDASEVQNGYDPAMAGTRLADSVRFRMATIGNIWSVLLPASWTLGLDATAPGDYRVDTGTLTNLSFHFSPKPAGMPFGAWLSVNEPTVDPESMATLTTKAGYDSQQSLDGLTTYLVVDTSVVVVRYMTNGATTYDFPSIYDYIIQNMNILP